MSTLGVNQRGRLTVVSLHGIRTSGKWQKTLSRLLSAKGVVYDPWDYGFFKALSLINPFSREKQIEAFRDQYGALRELTQGPISIVAHSFGTYIVAEAMARYSMIRFDRIIFCGSIVPVNYDWSNVLIKRAQANVVLNQYGRKDIWVRLAEWAVPGAGPSGYAGFNDKADGRVQQQGNKTYGHSQYFFGLNYTENWIPFLLGGNAPETIPLRDRGWNKRFSITLIAGLLLLTAICYAAWNWFIGQQDESSAHNEVVIAPHEAAAAANSKSVPSASEVRPSTPEESHASMVSMAIASDAACELTVDGASQGKLIANQPQEISFEAGKHEIKCVSAAPGIEFREILVATNGAVVRIDLATRIEEQKAEIDRRNHEYMVARASEFFGTWVATNTSSEELLGSCKRELTVTTFITFQSALTDGTMSGTYSESVRKTAVVGDANIFTPTERSCNKFVSGDEEEDTLLTVTKGTIKLTFNNFDADNITAIVNVTSCNVGGNDCDSDYFGKQDVEEVAVIETGKKLTFYDQVFSKR